MWILNTFISGNSLAIFSSIKGCRFNTSLPHLLPTREILPTVVTGGGVALTGEIVVLEEKGGGNKSGGERGGREIEGGAGRGSR